MKNLGVIIYLVILFGTMIIGIHFFVQNIHKEAAEKHCEKIFDKALEATLCNQNALHSAIATIEKLTPFVENTSPDLIRRLNSLSFELLEAENSLVELRESMLLE